MNGASADQFNVAITERRTVAGGLLCTLVWQPALGTQPLTETFNVRAVEQFIIN